MNKTFYPSGILFFCVLLILNLPAGSQPVTPLIKPFRVLVIIGDQWQDPASFMIDKPESTGEYSGYDLTPEVAGSSDFHHLCILLKSWGIPFDIIRLDQQFLDRYMFLDINNTPRYGTIIWAVRQSEKLLNPDYSIITEMVEHYGIGLIAIADRINQDEIQNILGIKYKGSWESSAPMNIKTHMFLTDGIASPFVIDTPIVAHTQRQHVETSEGTMILIEQGSYPQATAREYPSGARAVWIGNDHNFMFYFQSIRTLLRRAITWTVGYNLYKTWDNDFIMIMDDPGGSQSSWLEHWHYPQLTETIIDKYLIKPLQEHNAILNINFVPGFVNEGTKRMEPTWRNTFVDSFGIRQDFPSSKRGFDKGVKLGVFTVMCHGLTHMQPDLVSDPGWYGAALDKEKAEVGWYREFGDTRRKKEIPAAEQLWRMKISKEWLTEQFGVVPLEFCAGGMGSSISYFNNTVKLAALAGYGWCGWDYGYLGKDMVISGWKFFGTSESPQLVWALPDAHDFGISRDPAEFASIFKQFPQGRFISINEFIAYLHSSNTGLWNKATGKFTMSIEYNDHYCQFFNNHSSSWKIEVSDWLQKEIGKYALLVDGEKVKINNGTLEIPKGTGNHIVEIIY